MMDGERFVRALGLADGEGSASSVDGDVILLTDRRVVHLRSAGSNRKTVFVPLAGVAAVEVSAERSGYGGYVWGALAFVIAWLLWSTWDAPLWSGVAAVAVGLMGIYMIVDQFYSPSLVRATFKTSSSELSCGIRRADATAEVYDFVNRMFQLKGEDTEDVGPAIEAPPQRVFAPR